MRASRPRLSQAVRVSAPWHHQRTELQWAALDCFAHCCCAHTTISSGCSTHSKCKSICCTALKATYLPCVRVETSDVAAACTRMQTGGKTNTNHNLGAAHLLKVVHSHEPRALLQSCGHLCCRVGCEGHRRTQTYKEDRSGVRAATHVDCVVVQLHQVRRTTWSQSWLPVLARRLVKHPPMCRTQCV